ncbi:hypothetical protein AALF16_14805 [Bacillus cereus]|uniref:hypothetical protein n=1 Tax=Bacillus cereus TaxID=1396 RepID=UPI00356DD9C8
MSHFELNQSKYAIANFKGILHEKLILSKQLNKNEAKKLKLSNTDYEYKSCVPKHWFCSIDIGDWEDVEIIVHGNNEKPYKEFIDMAEQIFNQFYIHLSRSLKYLKKFFPTQEVDGYYLSTITFGQLSNFDDYVLSGFTLAFVYGDYPNAFQYKVKFKDDEWPIGFEGGPL